MIFKRFLGKSQTPDKKEPAPPSPDASAGTGPACTLDHKILVGPHHKTGTVWLDSIFRHICHRHGLTYYSGEQAGLPRAFDVFFQDHSRFDLDALGLPFRGVHIIRDPRDVIISGSFFHQKSDETWLHQPRKDLDGMTYQEKINSFSSLDDKILFEMEHIGRETLAEMMSWDYTNASIYEIKYEDLINDVDLIVFHKIFTFLGFHGSLIPSVLSIAWNNSLFSGRHGKSVHRRSGKANQWKNHFKPVHKKRFVDLFGTALVQLGYETDNAWAE